MSHQLLKSVLIFVLLHVIRTKASNNHTKRCFFKEKSEVIWNVTFTGDQYPDMTRANVVMQTQNQEHDHVRNEKNWNTLSNCKRDKRSIQCEIDHSAMRVKYFLRIIRWTNQSTSEYVYVCVCVCVYVCECEWVWVGVCVCVCACVSVCVVKEVCKHALG